MLFFHPNETCDSPKFDVNYNRLRYKILILHLGPAIVSKFY